MLRSHLILSPFSPSPHIPPLTPSVSLKNPNQVGVHHVSMHIEQTIFKIKTEKYFHQKIHCYFFPPHLVVNSNRKHSSQSKSTTQTLSYFFFCHHTLWFCPPPMKAANTSPETNLKKKEERIKTQKLFFRGQNCISLPKVWAPDGWGEVCKRTWAAPVNTKTPSGKWGEHQQKLSHHNTKNKTKKKKTWTGYTFINRMKSWGSVQRLDSHCLKSRWYSISILFFVNRGCVWKVMHQFQGRVRCSLAGKLGNAKLRHSSPRKYTEFLTCLGECMKPNGPRLHNVVVLVVVSVIQNAKKKVSFPFCLSFLCTWSPLISFRYIYSHLYIDIYIYILYN